MTRRTAAVLILTLWAGALAWLGAREYHGSRDGDRANHWRVPPGSAFQAIRLGGRQIGIASLTVDTVPEGLRVVELTTVDLPPIDSAVPRRTTHRVEALYSRELALVSWQSDLLSEHGREASAGRITDDTLLTVVQTVAGEPPETLTIRLAQPVILPGAVSLVAASRGLPKRGTVLELSVFDPLDLAVRSVRYEIAGESTFTIADSAEVNPTRQRWEAVHADTVRAWRLDGFEAGLPVSRWVDAAGLPVQTRHALGATFERSAFELVNTNFRRLPPPVWETGPDAPAYLAGKAGAPTPVPGPVRLRVVPPAPLLAVLPALDGGWQRRSGDTIQLGPSPAERGAPAISATIEPRLDADTAIAALGARLTQVPVERQLPTLEGWVRTRTVRRDGPGTASARLVLARGTGSAGDRVALLVAIAREAGLPARAVWGVAWQDGAWRLRPWAEVWSDGWTPVDPEASVRAGDRVRLTTGSGARLLDLAIRAGRVRLDTSGGAP